mmetsp:Transcript_43886/g.109923  ORF Transcript_43886/g.109923 Transcript_43886/m.109923 type:complete len:225 (+) Transcript_43886:99-773(+)
MSIMSTIVSFLSWEVEHRREKKRDLQSTPFKTSSGGSLTPISVAMCLSSVCCAPSSSSHPPKGLRLRPVFSAICAKTISASSPISSISADVLLVCGRSSDDRRFLSPPRATTRSPASSPVTDESTCSSGGGRLLASSGAAASPLALTSRSTSSSKASNTTSSLLILRTGLFSSTGSDSFWISIGLDMSPTSWSGKSVLCAFLLSLPPWNVAPSFCAPLMTTIDV